MTAPAPTAALARFTRYRVWAPEWWLLIPIAAAWIVAAGHASSDVVAALSSAGGGAWRAGQALIVVCLVPSVRTAGTDLTEAAAMSMAMMLPLALPVVRHVARNSLRRRQWRAMVLNVAAFLGPMIATGVAIAAIVEVLPVDRRAALVAALVVAGCYQLSPPKRRALADCRRLVPLAPDGRRADTAVVRFGLLSAWRCLRSSWALMLPIAVLGSSGLLVAVVVTGLLLAEDPGRFGRRILRPSAAALAAAAIVAGVVPVP